MSIKIARYGWKPDRPDKRDQKFKVSRAELKALPPVVDHRKYFPAPYDQGQAGACTGESTKGHLAYRADVDHIPNAVEPSALFIYYNGRLAEGMLVKTRGLPSATLSRASPSTASPVSSAGRTRTIRRSS